MLDQLCDNPYYGVHSMRKFRYGKVLRLTFAQWASTVSLSFILSCWRVTLMVTRRDWHQLQSVFSCRFPQYKQRRPLIIPHNWNLTHASRMTPLLEINFNRSLGKLLDQFGSASSMNHRSFDYAGDDFDAFYGLTPNYDVDSRLHSPGFPISFYEPLSRLEASTEINSVRYRLLSRFSDISDYLTEREREPILVKSESDYQTPVTRISEPFRRLFVCDRHSRPRL